MADMVGSAFVQETVSRGVSLVLDKREERASKGHAIERLEMAHTGLEFALERSSKLPVTDVSLLRKRKMIKRVYEECDGVLYKHKLRVLEDEEAEQGVTRSSSFPMRIIRAVKSSVLPLFTADKDELSLSAVTRFEWYADEASRFVRDVESGCSLGHYRFFSPLITQLLEGKSLQYEMVQGSQTHYLKINPVCCEQYGVLARLYFRSDDREIPAKCFTIGLLLRLSENTNIIGIATKCLQSLGPQFKSFAKVAMGELSQLPTQDFFHSRSTHLKIFLPSTTSFARCSRPDPLCCRANEHMPCAKNVIPSELSYRFPEQVIFIAFDFYISASDQNLQSSADQAERNAVNDWPPLKVSALFGPHCVNKWGEIYASEEIGEQKERLNGTSLQQTEEMVLANAITGFTRQPELTDYQMSWYSPHGDALFIVKKSKEKARPKPTAGPKTRRAAKRRTWELLVELDNMRWCLGAIKFLLPSLY